MMPYTQKQREMFNARARSDPRFKKLAEEANSLPVKRPVRKKKSNGKAK